MIGAALLLIDLAGATAALVLVVVAGNHLRLTRWHGRLANRLLEAPGREPATRLDHPSVLVQLPVFNEPESVVGALRAASGLDWPRQRLTIQLLDDSTDATSALAAAEIAALRAKGFEVVHLRRGTRAGFKAGALAAGMARSTAPFVAIFDADHRPPADWLSHAFAALAEDPAAAFLQTRFEVANAHRSWIAGAQQITVDAHFVIEQAGRAAAGEPIQFNGTGALWRREAILSAGGWSARSLAEDLDLALRALLAGRPGRLSLSPAVACEAPVTLGSFIAQQRRWSRGFLQVAHSIFPALRSAALPVRVKLAVGLLLLMQLAFPCAVLAAAALAADAALRGGFGPAHWALAAISVATGASVAVALTWPAWRRLRRGSAIRYACRLTMLPPLYAILAIANSAAILAAPFRAAGDFRRTPKAGLNREDP